MTFYNRALDRSAVVSGGCEIRGQAAGRLCGGKTYALEGVCRWVGRCAGVVGVILRFGGVGAYGSGVCAKKTAAKYYFVDKKGRGVV
jgi:hypothetical protein